MSLKLYTHISIGIGIIIIIIIIIIITLSKHFLDDQIIYPDDVLNEGGRI